MDLLVFIVSFILAYASFVMLAYYLAKVIFPAERKKDSKMVKQKSGHTHRIITHRTTR